MNETYADTTAKTAGPPPEAEELIKLLGIVAQIASEGKEISEAIQNKLFGELIKDGCVQETSPSPPGFFERSRVLIGEIKQLVIDTNKNLHTISSQCSH